MKKIYITPTTSVHTLKLLTVIQTSLSASKLDVTQEEQDDVSEGETEAPYSQKIDMWGD